LTRVGDGPMLEGVDVVGIGSDRVGSSRRATVRGGICLMTLRKRSMFLALALLSAVAVRGDQPMPRAKVVLVIHGGAGVLSREVMKAEREGLYRRALEQALRTGFETLQKGGRSLDAVEAAIKVLEDSPLFNAGKGAVFSHEGRNELDASIMEGAERRAGAVAGLTRIKNPISAARAVMERSPHVLFIGDGADRFAIDAGLEAVSPVYFWTPERWKELQDALERERQPARPPASGPQSRQASAPDRPFGTVGAVALDRRGDLAAGTSTGGMTNKRHGRVGDSPIIGAGTYADNATCAVSCTGHGEVFIRYAVAHEIGALMKYRKRTVQEAAREVLEGLPKEEGGVGGIIALDADGNAALEYNSEGMYRGTITEDGAIEIAIYARK
jgi:beta-aspartyl-peptidase (threonine type)